MDVRQYNAVYENIILEKKLEKIERILELANVIKLGAHAITDKKINKYFVEYTSKKEREYNKLLGIKPELIWDRLKRSRRL